MKRSLATLLLALAASAPARADYKDSYRKGIEALDRKRWEDVVKHMRAAIAENPSEGERIKLYGLRFEVYFPHFHLGAAYLNLAKCPEAQRAFEASQAQGAIRSHPKYAELVDGLKSCEGQVARATPAPPPATPTPGLPASPDPAALAQAVQPAAAASGPANQAAGRPAPLASERLEGGRREGERRPGGEGGAETAPSPSAPPAPRAPAAPSAELLAGAQAFFGGRYEDAIRLLERAAGLRARAAAQRALLQAAARFARYRIGGEQDAALRRQAAEDVAACRRADPALVPDAGAFSPQFVAFFRSVGEANR